MFDLRRSLRVRQDESRIGSELIPKDEIGMNHSSIAPYEVQSRYLRIFLMTFQDAARWMIHTTQIQSY